MEISPLIWEYMGLHGIIWVIYGFITTDPKWWGPSKLYPLSQCHGASTPSTLPKLVIAQGKNAAGLRRSGVLSPGKDEKVAIFEAKSGRMMRKWRLTNLMFLNHGVRLKNQGLHQKSPWFPVKVRKCPVTPQSRWDNASNPAATCTATGLLAWWHVLRSNIKYPLVN